MKSAPSLVHSGVRSRSEGEDHPLGVTSKKERSTRLCTPIRIAGMRATIHCRPKSLSDHVRQRRPFQHAVRSGTPDSGQGPPVPFPHPRQHPVISARRGSSTSPSSESWPRRGPDTISFVSPLSSLHRWSTPRMHDNITIPGRGWRGSLLPRVPQPVVSSSSPQATTCSNPPSAERNTRPEKCLPALKSAERLVSAEADPPWPGRRGG